MSRLSKLVREYVKCPQLDGGTEYGEWGALRLYQRKQIAKLCEEVDAFEDTADKFGKENAQLRKVLSIFDSYYAKGEIVDQYIEIQNLRKQLAEKDKEQNQKAIEQLEKVKKKILSYEEIYYQFLESGAKIPVYCVENFRVRQYIDQQINELKGKVGDER